MLWNHKWTSSLWTSSYLKSTYLFDVPHLGLIWFIHPFSFVHRHMCNRPLFHSENVQATLRKLTRKLHQNKNLQQIVPLKREVLTLAHSSRCLWLPTQACVLACICVFSTLDLSLSSSHPVKHEQVIETLLIAEFQNAAGRSQVSGTVCFSTDALMVNL